MPDTEEQIAARLSEHLRNQGVTQEPPEDNRTKAEELIEQDRSHNNLPLESMMAKHELLSYFNVAPSGYRNSDISQKIDTILQWASANTETREMPDILKVIRMTEDSLGNRMRQDRLDRLYRYVKLNKQVDLLKERMLAL